MFNCMKKILLGFAAKDVPLHGFGLYADTAPRERAANLWPANVERSPVSDAELGAFLVQRLAQDPSLSEMSLAAMTGRNVSYVRKLLAAAREQHDARAIAQGSPGGTGNAVRGSPDVLHLAPLSMAVHGADFDTTTSCEASRPFLEVSQTPPGGGVSGQSGCTTESSLSSSSAD